MTPGERNRAIKRLRKQARAKLRGSLKHLPAAEIYDAIDYAMSRVRCSWNYDEKTWKYFCGVCWGKIKDKERPQ